jgi:hypothetical protein
LILWPSFFWGFVGYIYRILSILKATSALKKPHELIWSASLGGCLRKFVDTIPAFRLSRFLYYWSMQLLWSHRQIESLVKGSKLKLATDVAIERFHKGRWLPTPHGPWALMSFAPSASENMGLIGPHQIGFVAV